MNNERVYLMINLCDLHQLGAIGSLGSPLKMFINRELGDTLVNQAVYDRKQLDQNFVLVHCKPERADAIKNGLAVISKKKLGRAVRTRIRKTYPSGKKWRTMSSFSLIE